MSRVFAAGLVLALAAGAAPAQTAEKLVIAVNDRNLGSALVLIAAGKGYFRETGVEVELRGGHTSGAAALAEAVAGRADLATVAEVPFMFAVLRGAPVSVIATISTSVEWGVVARRAGGIAQLADLKGKRLAATPGGGGQFALDAVLIANRIAPSSVRFTGLPPETLADALAQGEVDAVCTWEPYLSAAMRRLGEGGVHFPGDGRHYRTHFNLAARREAIARDPERMARVLRALVAAEQLAARSPAEARALLARATGITPADVERTWPMFSIALRLEQSLLPLLESQARWAIRHGYLEERAMPNFLEALHLDALLKVKPGAVTVIR